MPLFKVDIEKQLGTEFWTNVYYVDAASLTAAHAVGAEIVVAERGIHHVSVVFTKYRTSDTVPGTDQYITEPLNVTGARGPSTPLLPLFNVVRADLGVGIGRPSRKYLRGVLMEEDITFNNIDATPLALFDTDYANDLELIEELVDVDGQPIINVTINPQVGMRQLRRGSRRSTTPVIP